MKKLFSLFTLSLCFLFVAMSVHAQTNLYVNDSSLVGDLYTTALGSDVNPGTTTAPFLTINYAISQSNPGDTIYVDAGTYILTSGNVINKQLTFRGRQAGVDARTRGVVPESIVDAINLTGYASAFDVTPAANGSMIDGFTEQGGNGALGVGIWLELGTNGTTVQNNIIQNNIIGLLLSNNSAIDQTVIRQNLFQNNTNPGAASGTGIYADEYTAGTNLQNVLIKDNKFTNSSPVVNSWAMGMSNTSATAFTNITFQDNQVSNSGRGMYFYGTTSSTVSGNTITDATSYAVGIFDGAISNSLLTITGNTFTTCFRGIRINKSSPVDAYSGTLSPSGNIFTGGTYHLVNASTLATTTVINAVGNNYDGILLDGSTSLPDIFTIADKVLDAVDATPYGIIILKPFNVYVTVNSFYIPAGTSSPLVQRGVNITAPADTVHINSGSYTEQIEIDHDLVVIGQGAGATNIIAPATLPLFFTTSANNYPVIYGHDAANIVVKSLTIDGAGNGNSNHRLNGVGYFNAGGTISDLEVKAVRSTPINGAQGGTGIFGYANVGTARTLNVIKNNIYDFQKNGITMSGAVLTTLVDSNIVTGAGPINFIAQNGVQLSGGVRGSINHNTVSGVSYTPASVVSCGILVFNPGDTIRTYYNIVNDAQAGILYYLAGGTINSNTVSYKAANMGATPYWYGIYVENGTTTINQNTVNGGGNGVGVEVDAFASLDNAGIKLTLNDETTAGGNNSDANGNNKDAMLELTSINAKNNFVDSVNEGFALVTDSVGSILASINYNSITNYTTNAIHNYGLDYADGTCNWYGTADLDLITPVIIGPVVFIPYLVDSTDIDPSSPGFQPDPDACSGVLPVELSSLTSVVNKRDVTLNWITASELNNAGFDVERSVVNGLWSKVANVTGNGTTSVPMNYTYTDRNLASGKYNYRLKQIDFNGNYEYFNLSNEVNIGVPTKFDLSQNYPNPFNPTTKINYDLPFDGKVSIKIFDMSGREVSTLVNDVVTAGFYTINFNAANLSSGVYFYKITVEGNGSTDNGGFVAIKKMMLVK
ncbi:MAG: right-handed parallel beta-helix repeat-containing protein [Ignavibacteria bacterium]